MRVWLPVDSHAGPSVLDDTDMSSVDVLVGLDEVRAKRRGEELRRMDGVLFRHNIGGILHGVSRNHGAVVSFGVPSILSVLGM